MRESKFFPRSSLSSVSHSTLSLLSARVEHSPTEARSLGVCPITGIVISFNIPALPIPLIYSNPLTDKRNIHALAGLPFPKLVELPKEILAGLLLSSLSSLSLLSSEKDHTSSVEKNRILQLCTSSTLAVAIKLFAFLPKEKRELLEEALSFEPFFDPAQYFLSDEKSIDRAILNWVKNTKKAIDPNHIEKGLSLEGGESTKAYKIELSSRGKTKVTKVDNALRNEWKKHTATLFLLNTISEKFHDLLNKLTYGTLLNTMESEIRFSLFAKLDNLKKKLSAEDVEELTSLSTLMSILKRTDKESITETSVEDPEFYDTAKKLAEPHSGTDETATNTSLNGEPPKKLSIAEMLAAKLSSSKKEEEPKPSNEKKEESEDEISGRTRKLSLVESYEAESYESPDSESLDSYEDDSYEDDDSYEAEAEGENDDDTL